MKREPCRRSLPTVDRLAVGIGSFQFDENVTVVHEQSETAALDDKTFDGFQRSQIRPFDPHRAEAIEPLTLSGTDIDRGRLRVLHWRPELIAARTRLPVNDKVSPGGTSTPCTFTTIQLDPSSG